MALPIVNSGLAIIARRLQKQNGETTPSQPEPNWFYWGTGGATATTATMTGLQTPSAENPVQGTSSIVTTNVPNDTYEVIGAITSLSSQTISEVGQFDDVNPIPGRMLARWTFTGVPLNAGDSIQFTTQTYGV